MAHIFTLALALVGIITSVASSQTPSERFLRRVDEAESEAQVGESLRRKAAEIEARLAELNRQIDGLQNRHAELRCDAKAAHDRIAELGGMKAGAKPPLMFPASIERAMLGDGQWVVPRQPERSRLHRLPPGSAEKFPPKR